jgi:hypothetical protein
MPRLRVIILDQTSDDANTYNCVMWADVPAARQSYYANANAKSAWNGATAADNTNLQTGVMVEQLTVQRVPPNTPLAQVEAFMAQLWQNYQTQITGNNPWIHYGSTWDGTTWTILTGA